MPLSLLFLSFLGFPVTLFQLLSSSRWDPDPSRSPAGSWRTGCSLLYPEKIVRPAMKSHMDVELEREQEEEEEDKEEERGWSGAEAVTAFFSHSLLLLLSSGDRWIGRYRWWGGWAKRKKKSPAMNSSRRGGGRLLYPDAHSFRGKSHLIHKVPLQLFFSPLPLRLSLPFFSSSLPDGLLPTEPGSRHCVCLCVSTGSGGSSVRHVCDCACNWEGSVFVWLLVSAPLCVLRHRGARLQRSHAPPSVSLCNRKVGVVLPALPQVQMCMFVLRRNWERQTWAVLLGKPGWEGEQKVGAGWGCIRILIWKLDLYMCGNTRTEQDNTYMSHLSFIKSFNVGVISALMHKYMHAQRLYWSFYKLESHTPVRGQCGT